MLKVGCLNAIDVIMAPTNQVSETITLTLDPEKVNEN